MSQNAYVESLKGGGWNWIDIGGSRPKRRTMRRRKMGRWEPLSQRKSEALRQPERQGNRGESDL
jgi:hypothetical protein